MTRKVLPLVLLVVVLASTSSVFADTKRGEALLSRTLFNGQKIGVTDGRNTLALMEIYRYPALMKYEWIYGFPVPITMPAVYIKYTVGYYDTAGYHEDEDVITQACPTGSCVVQLEHGFKVEYDENWDDRVWLVGPSHWYVYWFER